MKTRNPFSTCSVVWLGLVLCSACPGQNPSSASQAGQPAGQAEAVGRERLTKMDPSVRVIYQDRRGVVWFAGSDRGVVSYDGTKLSRYTTADGLMSHAVIGIQEDASGQLHFETVDGVSKFDGQRFTTVEIKSGESAEWTSSPDDLWFSLGWDKDGPYRFDGQVLHYLPFPKEVRGTDASSSPYNPFGIYRIIKDSRGAVWFGTASRGLFRFDGTSLRSLYEDHLTTTPGGGEFGIRSIIEDQHGHFWFCNSRYRFEVSQEQTGEDGRVQYQRAPGAAYVDQDGQDNFPYFLSVTMDGNGDLWFATYDDGVHRQQGDKLKHYRVEKKGENVLLHTIYSDRQGRIWLGTQNAGVYQFNGQAFEPFQP